MRDAPCSESRRARVGKFARANGPSGARVDQLSERTRSSAPGVAGDVAPSTAASATLRKPTRDTRAKSCPHSLMQCARHFAVQSEHGHDLLKRGFCSRRINVNPQAGDSAVDEAAQGTRAAHRANSRAAGSSLVSISAIRAHDQRGPSPSRASATAFS